jgi:hypothetical protein
MLPPFFLRLRSKAWQKERSPCFCKSIPMPHGAVMPLQYDGCVAETVEGAARVTCRRNITCPYEAFHLNV